jgi:methyl-accepting chemotaxis protein
MNIHIENLTLNYSGEADPEKIDLIISKLDQIMKKQEEFNEIQAALNEVTNRMAGVVGNIKEDYTTLIKAVEDGTVSSESLAAHKTNVTKLGTIVTALEETAATVENPIPTTPIPAPPVENGEGTEN